ncbi:MAG: thymidine phosphorylase [Candidatus Bipolaricaulota bacterium]|nr:thymidine phosphorylase [Candidatus Bipolaricaulota bacterium]
MKAVELIRKKRDGSPLSKGEIRWLIEGYVGGEIPDYQISALLMAIKFQGMEDSETASLTEAMAHSGEMLDLSFIKGFPVDKHSTGGVGDKTTLVLVPLLAAFGLAVAKLSGRALGHTGGTIDKLESIPGFRPGLSKEEFLSLVKRFGLALADHGDDMVPADRLLYELRGVTATIDSLPLIVSSILSKKVAGGARGIIIDVKTGAGAFLPRIEDSRRLARSLVATGGRLGRKVAAMITDMSQPLGRMVGNALEVKEAISTLNGKGPGDLEELCCQLGAELILLSGEFLDRKQAVTALRGRLRDGTALAKFRQLIGNQGGDVNIIDTPSLLPRAANRIEVQATRSGRVAGLDALSIGRAANLLGAGRFTKEDEVDPAVGVELLCKVGEDVKGGKPVAILHINAEENAKQAMDLVRDAYKITEKGAAPPPLIRERIGCRE